MFDSVFTLFLQCFSSVLAVFWQCFGNTVKTCKNTVQTQYKHSKNTVKALSKLLKERYKLSPKAVIDERRILEMKRQLKGTTTPVKNIAYHMGFDEPTNMVKYFKKHTEFTPNGFRDDIS